MFVSGHDVSIADHVFVNGGVLFDAGCRIELEAGVAVGPRVQFVTSTHAVGPTERRAAKVPVVQNTGPECFAGHTAPPAPSKSRD